MPFKDFKKMGIVERILVKEIRDKRDNNPCSECGTFKNLNVHHIDNNPLKTYDEDNIIILCEKCHKLEHIKSNKPARIKY